MMTMRFTRVFGAALTRHRVRSYSTTHKQAYLEETTVSGVASLVFNRPQNKNAISLQLLQEFRQCLDDTGGNRNARALILKSSTDGIFCAGADLVERRQMTRDQVDKFLLDLRQTLTVLENLPVPTIAAIDGPALGGGLEIALACDIRVAASSVTKIGLPEVRLGIIPAGGGTQRMAKLLGAAKAKRLIFSGRMLNALEAHDIGLIDYVTADGSAFNQALEVCTEISQAAPLAVRAAKLAISRGPELGLEPGLDFERECYEPLLTSRDRVEALQAFKEKRSPVFRGE